MNSKVSFYGMMIIALLSVKSVVAQNLNYSGVLNDSATGTVISEALVSLTEINDSFKIKYTLSDAAGNFEFTHLSKGFYFLDVSDIAYNPVHLKVEVAAGNKKPTLIKIEKKNNQLPEIIITDRTTPVTQKDDTTEYNAGSFKVYVDATSADLLNKIPGLSIENGLVKYTGIEVVKITVDGKEFFGGDLSEALKVLPADIIYKIQVFDYSNAQDALTGFAAGNKGKVINIITKRNRRNGLFGNIYAGYGYLSDSRYAAGANLNYFNGDRRIALYETSTNCQNGQQLPKSYNNGVGLNYNDIFGKKKNIQFAGTYTGNFSANYTNTITERNYFGNNQGAYTYNENENAAYRLILHKVYLDIVYSIDDANSIIFKPKFNFEKGNQNYDLFIQYPAGTGNDQTNLTRALASTNITQGNDLVYLHTFKNKSRQLSIDIFTTFNQGTEKSTQNSVNIYDNPGDTLLNAQKLVWIYKALNLSAKLTYNEPAGKNGLLQFSYSPAFITENNTRITTDINNSPQSYSTLDSSLSCLSKSMLVTHNGGLAYRLKNKKINLLIGLDVQYSLLKGSQLIPDRFDVYHAYFNTLPKVIFNYRLSQANMLTVNYYTTPALPSINQLQNVVDNSNPLFLTTGNPGLRQSYNNTVILKHSYTNTSKGLSLFSSVSAGYTGHVVSNSTIIAAEDTMMYDRFLLSKGATFTMPVNLAGSWNISASVNSGLDLSGNKLRLNLDEAFNYNITPALIDNSPAITRSLRTNSSLLLTGNINNKLDFNIRYGGNFNAISNILQQDMNSLYFTQLIDAGLNWIFYDGFIFSTNIQSNLTTSFATGFNQNTVIWNASLGYKFLKNRSMELGIGVKDLLNQNNIVTRVVTSSYIEDSKSSTLKRYLLVTFTYRPKFFKGA